MTADTHATVIPAAKLRVIVRERYAAVLTAGIAGLDVPGPALLLEEQAAEGLLELGDARVQVEEGGGGGGGGFDHCAAVPVGAEEVAVL